MKNAPIMLPNRQKQSSRKLCGKASGVDTMNSLSTISLSCGANGCRSGRLTLQYFTWPPGPLDATGLKRPLFWPPATADTAASPIPDCCSRLIACTTLQHTTIIIIIIFWQHSHILTHIIKLLTYTIKSAKPDRTEHHSSTMTVTNYTPTLFDRGQPHVEGDVPQQSLSLGQMSQ